VTPVVAEWGYVLPEGKTMPEGKAYQSDTNDLWMSQEEIRYFLSEID
jgi:UDP-N-acetylglucosamine 4,6-dehydratase